MNNPLLISLLTRIEKHSNIFLLSTPAKRTNRMSQLRCLPHLKAERVRLALLVRCSSREEALFASQREGYLVRKAGAWSWRRFVLALYARQGC